MNKTDFRSIRIPRKVMALALLFISAALLLSGCAGPEGGSSIPWAEPEPWEQQPNFGVPY